MEGIVTGYLLKEYEDEYNEGWTQGVIYFTEATGCLIDDDDDLRMSPEDYNDTGEYTFIEVQYDVLNGCVVDPNKIYIGGE